METSTRFATPAKLSNKELLAQVRQLVQHDRETTVRLIAYLAEMDKRRVYLGQGCSSLYVYCTRILHMSEYEAYGRIQAARAARRFPLVLDMLASGEVNLTTIKLLSSLFTQENHRKLLEAARFKSKREVEELVAALSPKPSVPASIRKLPSRPESWIELADSKLQTSTPENSVRTKQSDLPSPECMPEPSSEFIPAERAAEAMPQGTAAAEPEAMGVAGMAELVQAFQLEESIPAARRPVGSAASITPLASDRYLLKLTASRDTYQKLRRAQDLLRHKIPTGDPAAVFDLALTMLVEHLEKTRLGKTEHPRASRGVAPGSRHIPAAVRREVWERDGGTCAFVGENGCRCGEPGLFQWHHLDPHADGGPPTVSNIELRCAAHNRYEAELYFGPSMVRPPGKRGPADGSGEALGLGRRST